MSNDSSSTIPPFHSLPFSAYYRTECQDKYSTSRLAYHVAYIDNECASSLQLTPCLDGEGSGERIKPSYDCKTFVHGHQYSRRVRCFGPWVDAAGFTNATLSEISRRMVGSNSNGTNGSGGDGSSSRNTSNSFEFSTAANNCYHHDQSFSHGTDCYTNRNHERLSKT
mmetsp:Transcript_6160/g.15235  ORF Transcript_6160/g.15235 Transcript_6160/m.15235 type:complete len:167 (+) Transcript_6160:80-580(+)